MFLEFFYKLRARGVPVTTHTWLALVEALARGILIQNEAHYDDFDRVFAESFKGVLADTRDLLAQVEAWLKDPKLLESLDPELRAQLAGMDLEQLRRELQDRLDKQKERHD